MKKKKKKKRKGKDGNGERLLGILECRLALDVLAEEARIMIRSEPDDRHVLYYDLREPIESTRFAEVPEKERLERLLGLQGHFHEGSSQKFEVRYMRHKKKKKKKKVKMKKKEKESIGYSLRPSLKERQAMGKIVSENHLVFP
ncbi:hypothetical protein KPH14_001554 [Odynerus spinipes]|uniref:Uncharacterized protein n=1 Tax=Odynerus spinipes TaxID=1348599 RepID=A0AAD9RV00_9HYME|nr:hypothetical protein KPH14_001554 [Odynerus spinipes]